jgi:pyruvate,water dikinase
VVINAVFGLADRLVSGEVTPTEYAVSQGNISVIKDKGKVLSDAQLRLLSASVKTLESEFGQPQDVEWAFENDELFILQSRPITALPPQPIPIVIDVPKGTWQRDDHHTTPSPLMVDIWMDTYFQEQIKEFRKFGMPIKNFIPKLIGGHLYAQMQMEGGEQKGEPPYWVMWLVARLLPMMRKMNRDMEFIFSNGVHHQEMIDWEEKHKPFFVQRIAELRQVDVPELDNKELLRHFNELVKFSQDGAIGHANTMGNWIAMGEFNLFCQDHLGWDMKKVVHLTGGWSKATSFVHDKLTELVISNFNQNEASELLAEIENDALKLKVMRPEFAAKLDAWIGKNALRMQDYDLHHPTLGEHPELIYQNVVALLKQLASGTLRKTISNLEREREFALARTKLAGTPQLEEFENLAKWCQRAYSLRDENGYYTVTQPSALLRLCCLEMGKRIPKLERSEHIFYLKIHELIDASEGRSSNTAETVRIRRGEEQWAKLNRGPKVYGPPEAPMPSVNPFPPALRKTFRIFGWMMESEMSEVNRDANLAENMLQGRGASAGKYTGSARIVRGPKDFKKVELGDIMVCRITSGEWSMVFSRVGALVTDEGGFLSHPAIIAREFGVPAVVGTDEATAKIKDGSIITVDGNTGMVRW